MSVVARQNNEPRITAPCDSLELAMFGDWRVERVLGEGSFGQVSLARDRNGRTGALKIYPAEMTAQLDLASLAKLATIHHPNLGEILDHGTDDSGRSFVVTRYIDGSSLADLLAQRGALSVDEVRTLGKALSRGLATLHQRGMVHRDIKPDNILLPNDGNLSGAVLVDFGLVGERKGAASTTRAGAFIGSPAYMAPEQARGLGLTNQADLWSLGAVLYEASAGARPFEGESIPSTLMAILTQPVDLGRLPEPLHSPIRWALERNTAQRVPNAEALALALERPTEVHAKEELRTAFSATGPPVAGGAPALETSVLLGRPESTAAGTRPWLNRTGPRVAAVFCLVCALVFLSIHTLRLGLALGACVVSGTAIAIILARIMRRGPANEAQRTRLRVQGKEKVTASIALAVDELAKRYRNNPHAKLVTQSMALVFAQYEAVTVTDPQAQLELTLKALDAVMKLEARIAAVATPWYQRYDKPVTVLGALGTACVTWWGLGQTFAKAADPSGPNIFRGCPSSPVSAATRVRIETADGSTSVEWSLGQDVVMVSRSFIWPDDVKTASGPGVYVVWGKVGERKERCVIEARQ